MRKPRATFQALIGLSLWMAAGAWSATEGLAQYLRADAPGVYTVVKGDTLWDLSLIHI